MKRGRVRRRLITETEEYRRGYKEEKGREITLKRLNEGLEERRVLRRRRRTEERRSRRKSGKGGMEMKAEN